ncbi:hypothetical protein B9P90_03600 [Citrobacter freundii]|uniref:Uncharacterized protein n=1 Tax=Citrobacter freundii TaxID=546 RepID=A0AA44NN28_CITFR|nr:hypothetical protein [Citrobacter freundii]OYR00293.1 hypothetical protein B9P90_03600 [Citrobacter freundii]OYR06107.1 hypothetical protein B9P89_07485 [Citrobacter freundii]
MNDVFFLEGRTITSSNEIFGGVNSESIITIINCNILISEVDIPSNISAVIFVLCACNLPLTINSENEKTELRFEYGNIFKQVLVGGDYDRVIFNSTPLFGRVKYPRDYKSSKFSVISFLKNARANRLEFLSLISNSIKCEGAAKDFLIHEANVSEDVTIISSESNLVSIRSLETKELHFVGDFREIHLGYKFNIGTLSFNASTNRMQNVQIDMQDSSIYQQLQIANATDSKVTQFIIKNAGFKSIKNLVLHQSLLSCFVMSNCDLTKTEVSFINCKIDDLLMEGVSWPFNIEVSHHNYRKQSFLEFEQKQSVYRQLKSISQRNKDVDNFYFFRRREYDTTLSILSRKMMLFFSYFITILCDILGLGRKRFLPVIDKMAHENKYSGFVSVLSCWIILKISSLVSVHGTSLFRPVAILLCGIPLLLCIFGYYESIEQLLALSAYVIDPTHKLDASILGEKITLNPIHSLVFKIISSSLLFKIVLVFRKYAVSL